MSQQRYAKSNKGGSQKYQQRALNQAWIKTRWRMTLLITSYNMSHLFVTDSRLCNFPQQLRFSPIGACILCELCQDTLCTRHAKHRATCLCGALKSQGSRLRAEAENRGPEGCIPNRSGHKQADVSTQSQACSSMLQTTHLERGATHTEMKWYHFYTLQGRAFV